MIDVSESAPAAILCLESLDVLYLQSSVSTGQELTALCS